MRMYKLWLVTYCALFVAQSVLAETVTTVRLPHNNITLLANLVEVNDNKNAPFFLITHGTLAHNKMEIISAMQTELAAENFSSLAVNLSYSINARQSAMLDCGITHQHKHEDAVSELAAWVKWVQQAGYNDVYLVGHSRGGAQTAWYMTQSPPLIIKGAVLIAPANNSPEKTIANYKKNYGTTPSEALSAQQGKTMLENIDFIYCRKAHVAKDTFNSYYKNEPRFAFSHSAKTIDQPLLVVAGSEDEIVPLTQADVDAIQKDNASFLMVDGADHFFRDLYMLDIVEGIKTWITKTHQ